MQRVCQARDWTVLHLQRAVWGYLSHIKSSKSVFRKRIPCCEYFAHDLVRNFAQRQSVFAQSTQSAQSASVLGLGLLALLEPAYRYPVSRSLSVPPRAAFPAGMALPRSARSSEGWAPSANSRSGGHRTVFLIPLTGDPRRAMGNDGADCYRRGSFSPTCK